MRFAPIATIISACAAFSLSNLFDLTNDTPATIQETEPVPGNTPIEVCESDTKQLFEFSEVTLDPELPEAGKNLTIYAAGILKTKVVDGAYVDVTATYGLITLLRQRYDLCENLGEVDLECPVEAGEIVIEKTVQMPDTLPPGQYTVLAKAYTGDDELLSCVTAQVVLGY